MVNAAHARFRGNAHREMAIVKVGEETIRPGLQPIIPERKKPMTLSNIASAPADPILG